MATSTLFALRLNRLFNAIQPLDRRGPYLNAEVVADLRRRGFAISAPYLSQLRNGQRKQPSVMTMTALAEFFGVRPEYFTGEVSRYQRKLDAELEVLVAGRDPAVRQLVGLVAQLPDSARAELL